MWTFALSSSNHDLPTSGRRCRPVALIVACVVIVVATSFAQGDLTMPNEPFEPCHRSSPREAGLCPQYYYCSQRDSRCEPCSLCAGRNCDGSIAKCEESTILAQSERTYMFSRRHDLSPSCDATELWENRLLSASCSRHCFHYNYTLLCFVGTECSASCMLPPGVGRDGGWRWSSICSCHLSSDKQLVCSWTELLPACTNSTVTIPYETTEGTPPPPPPQPYPVVDDETSANDSANTPLAQTQTAAIVASVCAVVAMCSAIAVIAVCLRLRRRIMCHGRKKVVADKGHSDKNGASVATTPHASGKGTAIDGQATVINNVVQHTNVLVSEVSHLSVGGSGCPSVGPPTVRRQGGHGQLNRGMANCGHAGRPPRPGPCAHGCSVASPTESKLSTVHAASVSDGVGGLLRRGKCWHLSSPRAPSRADGYTADGDSSREPDGERDECEESGGCSSPLLQWQPEEVIQTTAADLPFCYGRHGDGVHRREYAGSGGHCGDDSFDVEADAVPDDLAPPCIANKARPSGGGDWSSLTEPGMAATPDCGCCISGRCATCSGADDGGGCRHDGSRYRDDLAEGEWPDSCESTNSSDPCSAEVAFSREGHSETSHEILTSAEIVDPPPNVRAVPSQRSAERTVIKADRVGLLEIIPTADAAQAGKIAADLELGNVGLLRVGFSTAVATSLGH